MSDEPSNPRLWECSLGHHHDSSERCPEGGTVKIHVTDLRVHKAQDDLRAEIAELSKPFCTICAAAIRGGGLKEGCVNCELMKSQRHADDLAIDLAEARDIECEICDKPIDLVSTVVACMECWNKVTDNLGELRKEEHAAAKILLDAETDAAIARKQLVVLQDLYNSLNTQLLARDADVAKLRDVLERVSHNIDYERSIALQVELALSRSNPGADLVAELAAEEGRADSWEKVAKEFENENERILAVNRTLMDDLAKVSLERNELKKLLTMFATPEDQAVLTKWVPK